MRILTIIGLMIAVVFSFMVALHTIFDYNSLDDYYANICEERLGIGSFDTDDCPEYKNTIAIGFYKSASEAQLACQSERDEFKAGLPVDSVCSDVCEMRLSESLYAGDAYDGSFSCGRWWVPRSIGGVI